MKVEIKLSSVKRSGKKISVKETFKSLEDARAYIEKCLFIKTKQELKIWMMRGCPNMDNNNIEFFEQPKKG